MKKMITVLSFVAMTIFSYSADEIFTNKNRLGIGVSSKPFTNGVISIRGDVNPTIGYDIMLSASDRELTLGTEMMLKINKHSYGNLYLFGEGMYNAYSEMTSKEVPNLPKQTTDIISTEEIKSQVLTTFGIGIETSALFIYNYFIPLKMTQSPINIFIEAGITRPWTENIRYEYQKPKFFIVTTMAIGIHYYF